MTERRIRHSIKRRLLVVLLLVTLLAWGIALVFSYRDTRHELDELLDGHLAQSASLLIAQVGHEADDLDTERAPQLHRYSRNVAFQVWEKGRKLVLHSASAPNTPLSSTHEGFSNSRVDGKSWRVFSAWDDSRRFLIQIGERRKVREELAEDIAENLLRPLLFTLPVLGLLIWFGVARGLRPLQTLSGQVAQRRADNLAALEDGVVPVEVLPLVQGLNHLFARRSLSSESRSRANRWLSPCTSGRTSVGTTPSSRGARLSARRCATWPLSVCKGRRPRATPNQMSRASTGSVSSSGRSRFSAMSSASLSRTLRRSPTWMRKWRESSQALNTRHGLPLTRLLLNPSCFDDNGVFGALAECSTSLRPCSHT